MLKCWEADVDERLSFKDIIKELDEAAGKFCGEETS